MDDSQAISAILLGDKDRYEELVGKYRRMVYAIAWSHLGNTDLSEDAAQETFVKAYCYLGTLREPGRFSPWLAMIARNVCSSFRRRAKGEDIRPIAPGNLEPQSGKAQIVDSIIENRISHCVRHRYRGRGRAPSEDRLMGDARVDRHIARLQASFSRLI